MRFKLLLVAVVVVAAPLAVVAQNGDLTHQQAATTDANVDFGVLLTGNGGHNEGTKLTETNEDQQFL